MFFLWYLGSLRLFFTLVLPFLPPLCFQNKAPVSESHLVRATPIKHKAPGLRKFLAMLHPKQKCLFTYLTFLLNKKYHMHKHTQTLNINYEHMCMQKKKKKLQFSTGCLCLTAINTSFSWGFTVNYLCDLTLSFSDSLTVMPGKEYSAELPP